MQSPLKMPEVELPRIELSDLPKFDLSEIPKVDVGKALADAAASAGLATRRRARWPYVLGAGIVVVATGWAVMNWAAIRERLSATKSWIGDQLGAMPSLETDQDTLTPTLTSPTSPFDQTAKSTDFGEMGADYPDKEFPEGVGAPDESRATNGRSTAASRR